MFIAFVNGMAHKDPPFPSFRSFMSFNNLFAGFGIFKKEFSSPDWNISRDGETVIVWDEDTEGCELPDRAEELEKLGWHYDHDEQCWFIDSPIY